MSNDQENGEAGSGNENFYDEYGGHNVIYAQYDITTSRINAQSKDKSVVVKIWKRKWWLIGLTFVLIIVSIAIGLGIHFGAKPEPPPTTIPQIPSTGVIASNSPSSTTNRSETVVLILSTYLPSNVPMLIGLNRKSDMIFFFNSYIFC